MKSIIAGPIFYLKGGLEIDGREISPLDPSEIRVAASTIVSAGINRVAVVGVFSALDHDGRHEEKCKSIMLEHDPSLSIVCSHTIGGNGLLPRENATILNASILSLANKAISGYRRAISNLGLGCPLYLTQNDGTLTDASTAAALPIKTFASGATNSMMGAAFLQGLDITGVGSDRQVIVVDIGGTSTDVGALLPSGFPKPAPNFVEVGGVRTAFSMPDVLSIGLGGGSHVKIDGSTGTVDVGPESVGYRLVKDAMVFGGSRLTATDIAVRSGAAKNIGDSKKVASVPSEMVAAAAKVIKVKLERLIDEMRVSAAPVTVLLVGGGSVILTDKLEGVTECLSPPHHDSANAVGAAIAKVAGETDVIEILAEKAEKTAIEEAKRRAIDAAIQKGADATDIAIVELHKIPLQYVNNRATRFLVKAAGRLSISAVEKARGEQVVGSTKAAWTPEEEFGDSTANQPESKIISGQTQLVDISRYKPDVRNRVWYLSPTDVELIACGTGILGTGGGGSSYEAALHAIDILLHKGGAGKMRVISPNDIKDTDLCVFGAGYGAPSVSNERIASGKEIFAAIDGLNRILGYSDFQGVVADEIGGGNGLATFPSSVRYDRPIIDADLMGRAYPTMEHGTPYVYGERITPCAMADAKGNVSVVVSAESNKKVEGMLRTTCVELGNAVAVASTPLIGQAIKKLAIPNTVSQAWYLGRAVHLARKTRIDPIEAIANTTTAIHLYSGKIIDVSRDVSKGYTVGRCLIGPNPTEEAHHATKSSSRNLVIPFQNEYLCAAYISDVPNESEDVICTVPDLISILGEDGHAIGSQDLRYGLRVHVIGMPAHPLWTGSEEGLRVGGPEFFGLQMKWKSIGLYQAPRSVIDEFNVSS